LSETAPTNKPLRLIAYGVVALAIVFELIVVWWMLHPQVPDDYRAYYIDKSTTCLNQPVSGDYALGSLVSFRDDGAEPAKPLRVCGWSGPAGDGTHAMGQTSRLRFTLPAGTTGPLALDLELVAIEREGYPSQRVAISVNGVALETVTALAGQPLTVALQIPAAAIAAQPDRVELFLDFPDAIRMGPSDSNTRMRSIKLLAARLANGTTQP
jgi:hypothetical protein